MNPTNFPRRFVRAGIVGMAAALGLAALQKGGTAFSKRNETPLLTEPQPLAAAAGKVAFAEELDIEEVRGMWLRVKSAQAAGWVFAGHVAEEKPTLPPPAGLTTLSASETETAAAARPLTKVAAGFAERHGAVDAQADLDWLETEAAKVKAADVETFLRENKKGEYQQ